MFDLIDNPDFALSRSDMIAEADRMLREPRNLARPLVLLNGWRSPGHSIWYLARRLRRLVGAAEEQLLTMSYPLADDIEAIAPVVSARVAERFGSMVDGVDVVAVSMGGLVARLAAAERALGGCALPVRRLFTLGSPHRGARLAKHVWIDRASWSMRPGSAFLARLDAALDRAPYELIAYARLNDGMVGAKYASPHGSSPIWTGSTRFFAHWTICYDPGITLDIARRLRGEQPLARAATPPPIN